MSDAERNTDLLSLAADVVASYVSKNIVGQGDLAKLIADVHQAMASIADPASAPQAEVMKPRVPVKKSITDDYLISLEDGKQYKTLKRHLAGVGLTPDEYRAKWGLPSDYPMVAPAYARRRSELAKSAGLGHMRRKPAPAPDSAPAAKKTKGRKKGA